VEALQKTVEAYCQKHNLILTNDKIVIGVSGGPDSVCLLHLLKSMAPAYNLQLHVAHLHHGLRGPAAGDDAAYVAELGRQWGLPVTVQTVDVAAFARQHGLNLEDAARRKRYAFLAQVAREIGAAKVAVAHQANDQAETVLMHFLRGAGVSGLTGMKPLTALAGFEPLDQAASPAGQTDLLLIRPLLETTRAQITRYCQAHHLSPRLDASNQDLSFRRNKIRHHLLPLLAHYNPNIYETLTRTAALMAADQVVLQQALERAWPALLKTQTEGAIVLALFPYQDLSLALQRGILRRAIQKLHQSLADIAFDHIEQAVALIQNGHVGSQLDLPHSLRLILDYDTVTLTKAGYTLPRPDQPRLARGTRLPLDIPGLVSLPDTGWSVQTVLLERRDLTEAEIEWPDPWRGYFDAEKIGPDLYLRTRKPGDQFYPFGLAGHHQRLKVFMIKQKIPATERDYVPLLVSGGDDIHWVCGWRTGHHSRVTARTKQVLQVQFNSD